MATTIPTLWLRADQGLTTDLNDRVSDWADQSGQGHNASQGNSGSRPRWIPDAINGHPALRFDGPQFMTILGQVLTSQQFTIVAVVNDTRGATDASFRAIFSNWSVSNQLTSVFLGTVKQDPVRVRLTDNLGGADPPYSQQGAGQLVEPITHFVLTGISGATDAKILQNDNLIADKGSALTTRNLSTGYAIGQQGASNLHERWVGDIAELQVFNQELTSDELQKVWNDVGSRYGIVVPEPASYVLLGVGGMGILGFRHRRRLPGSPPHN